MLKIENKICATVRGNKAKRASYRWLSVPVKCGVEVGDIVEIIKLDVTTRQCTKCNKVFTDTTTRLMCPRCIDNNNHGKVLYKTKCIDKDLNREGCEGYFVRENSSQHRCPVCRKATQND